MASSVRNQAAIPLYGRSPPPEALSGGACGPAPLPSLREARMVTTSKDEEYGCGAVVTTSPRIQFGHGGFLLEEIVR